ncbi:uncharacterized protein HD556DRAFT_1540161 [Suillus plorans]|uniref:Uncharacterized protein n=1 Tax=Suillus plorans TaxID=116603 RepID=A0A9P7AC07_9AGAM|nr:uncharacterized protein HD556DRAFT_1540161 [Suillus plorans]KAG1785276.1 hypothetical protein HD556DRAFT_1540161 [Suillus plorans]
MAVSVPEGHTHRDNHYFPRIIGSSVFITRRQAFQLQTTGGNFRLASRHPTQGLPERVQAYNWTVAAEQHSHTSALDAYNTYFDLLDGHLAIRVRSLPVDAASCAICHGNLRQVIELAEQGRGQQWSLPSRLRTPVEDLQSANPTLAHNYLELSKRILNAVQRSPTLLLLLGWQQSNTTHIYPGSQNDLIVLLTVWDKIMLLIVNVLQHDLTILESGHVQLQLAIHVHSSPRSSHVANKRKSVSRQLMKKYVPPSLVTIGQGGGTRVVKYAIKFKDNRTVSHLCVHYTIKLYGRKVPGIDDTMKIQFTYYLTILAAAAGVNAALASTCIYDCQDPDAAANCGAGWGLVWNTSLEPGPEGWVSALLIFGENHLPSNQRMRAIRIAACASACKSEEKSVLDCRREPGEEKGRRENFGCNGQGCYQMMAAHVKEYPDIIDRNINIIL